MNFLLIFIPAILILALSAAASKLFGFKIEQAHFLSVCGITLILILCGLIGILSVGFFVIIAAAVIGAVYIVITKFDIKKIFTPAITGYLIGLSIYIFFSRGSLLFDHDDVVHWAYATKCMYFSDTFYKGLQAMFTPTFNYFVTKSSLHFSETTLFSGSWIIIWSCFMLPLKDLTWKDWKRVAAVMAVLYFILGFLYGNVSLHIDQSLGYMSGAIIAYTAMNKNKTAKDYIIIFAGLLALSQMKDSFGAVVSMLTAVFVILAEVMQNFRALKKKMPVIIGLFFTPVIGYFLAELTIDKPAGYLPTENLYEMPAVTQILHSKATIALAGFLVAGIILLFIFLVKKDSKLKLGKHEINLYIIFGVLSALIAAGLLYKLSSIFLGTMTFTERAEFWNAWRDFFYHTYSGLTNKYLIGIVGVIFVASGAYAIKREYRKEHFTYFGYIIFAILAYAMLVLVAFAAGFQRSGMYSESVSWERYLSVPLIMMLVYMIMYFFAAPDVYEDDKKHRLIFMALAAAVAIRYMPYPGIIYNSKSEPARYGPSGFVERYSEHSDIILANVEKDNTVYMVTYPSDGTVDDKSYGYYPSIYIKYAIAPIQSNWLYDEYHKLPEHEEDVTGLINEIMKYDYLYIQSAGKNFYDVMDKYFQEGARYASKALYRINTQDGTLKIEPVFTEEAEIIK
jgi:hypothetical protein